MNRRNKNQESLSQLEFLLVCRVQDFHNEGYLDMSVQLLENYLLDMKWKNRNLFLHEMTKEVQELTYGEVIDYLRLENIFHAKEESLHKIFNNLI